jgi:hypothetical protein
LTSQEKIWPKIAAQRLKIDFARENLAKNCRAAKNFGQKLPRSEKFKPKMAAQRKILVKIASATSHPYP